MARPLRRTRVLTAIWLAFWVTLTGWGVATRASALEVKLAPMSIDRVDATGDNLALDVAAANPGAASALEAEVGGREVKPVSVQPLSEVLPSETAVVIDNSTTLGNGPVQLAKEAVLALGPDGPVATSAVVTAGGRVRTVVPATGSETNFAAGVGQVSPSEGGALLWDASIAALDSLGSRGAAQRNLVLVVGSPDVGSATTLGQLDARLARDNVRVHVMALAGGTPDTATLMELVTDHGGTFQAGSSDELHAMATTVAGHIGHQFRVVLPGTDVPDGELGTVRLEWGDARAESSFKPGVVSAGWSALRVSEDTTGVIDSLMAHEWVKWLLVAMGTAAAAVAAYSIFSLIVRSQDGIDFALRHYDSYVIDDVDSDYDDDPHESIAKTEILKRAVAFTGSLAERQGLLTRVEDLLERADLPLRPAEALFFYISIAVVAVVASFFMFDNLFLVAGLVILALLLPNLVVKFRAKRRKKKFVAQLPDMLQLLSGTLRAGYSISQGFDAVSKEIEDPMGRELRRVMTEARLGRPLEEALDAAAHRMQSEDFEWAVMAIRIQREVGGNLAELLMTVAETMTQRERLRRDVAALTAEGRMSAIVLGCLPPGLAVVMYVMNPEYIGRLFRDGIGIGMLVAACVSMLIGFAWMKKVITIEI